MTTPLEQKLTKVLEPLIAAEGYDLVQLAMVGEGRGTILQILVEDPLTHTIDLDSCGRLSRTIGTHLEVEDVIKGAYRLEISSPGIDRPLTKPAHYARYQGFEVKIETIMPINEQRRFHGKIIASSDEAVTLETETKVVELAFTDIARAKLKLTDDLIRKDRPANMNKSQSTHQEDHEGVMEK